MTKSIVISSLVIILCTVFVGVCSLTSRSILSDLLSDLSAADTTEDYLNFEKEFKSHEIFLSLFLEDRSISEIECAINELISFAKMGSDDEAEGIKSRLYCLIEEQRRQSGLNINSIF